MELPNVGMSKDIHEDKMGLENLWIHDDSQPLFDQPKYSDKIFFMWKEGYSGWMSEENEIYLYNNGDGTFLFST